jgi:cation transport regulator
MTEDKMSDRTLRGEGFSDEIRGTVNDYINGQEFSPELSEPVTEKYASIADLPNSVQRQLPPEAQDVYRQAFNYAYMLYDDPEDRYDENSRLATCHAFAWGEVKKSFTRVGSGQWMMGRDNTPRR